MRHNDVVQFLHVPTDTILLTHDVASPLMPTNQEFTTVARDDEARYNETLFKIDIYDAHEGEPWHSKSGHFKLIHQVTHVALWTYASILPDWAHGHQEVNGNKKAIERSNIWYVDDIIADGSEWHLRLSLQMFLLTSVGAGGHDFRNRTVHVEDKPQKHVNFFKKFAELQILMLQHNAGLTASHPYASGPFNWPFVLGGISFWTHNEDKRQIYMIGNVASWWICVIGLSVFTGVMAADTIARRRGLDPIEDRKHVRVTSVSSLMKALRQLFATACSAAPASSSAPGLSTTSPSTS